MSSSTHFHRQVLDYLRQYSHHCDVVKALSWMVSALICSGQLSLQQGAVCAQSCSKAQSVSATVFDNKRVDVCDLFAVGSRCSKWLAIASPVSGVDTTVLWNRYCMIHLSVVCSASHRWCGSVRTWE